MKDIFKYAVKMEPHSYSLKKRILFLEKENEKLKKYILNINKNNAGQEGNAQTGNQGSQKQDP